MANVQVITRKVDVGLTQVRKVLVVRPAAVINNGTVINNGGASSTFTQATPEAIWSVSHNLGRYPIVRLKTLGSTEIEGQVDHLSLNQFTVTFNTPQAGQAVYI